ncbi:MAG: helix-turn-helix domain-containing protein [Planctomycetota bacterium]
MNSHNIIDYYLNFAAKILGIGERTLYRKIKEYNL